MAVLPTRAKGIILILAGGILFLFFLFWNDVSSVRNRFHLPDGPYDGGRPPRPQYPPFNPPPLDVPPPAHEHDEGLPRPKPVQPVQDVWKTRAEAVKQSFLHAYNGYEKYAFPADELRPLSNGKVDNFNGWGVSAVDALDTMLLMGLNKEFDRAIQHVATINFTMPTYEYAPFFETVIRYLGGFLSAYALSGEPILLSRADELGMKLLPAFNTTSGLPVWGINTENGKLNDHGTVLLAEMGSCQMEYKYLAHLTGRIEFFKAADRVMNIMINTQHPVHAMWPTTFTIQGGTPVNDVYTIGALADSAYEYLLKQYIMSNKTEIRLAELYMKSITGVLTNLVYISPTRNLVYVTDSYYGMRPSRKFEHLSCFFPGLLALGVAELPPEIMTPELKEIHMWAAEAIGHSCWVMYADRKSGLGPETVTFEAPTSATFNPMPGQTYEEQQKVQQRMLEKERWMTKVGEWVAGGRKGHGGAPPGVRDADGPLYGKEGKKDYFESDDNYLLRPETLESMFVLWRTTGDSKWRDRGWEIWSSIEANTKTESGYASQNAVTRETMIPQESLPSYFFAETIKYAYLLTLDPSSDPLPESKFVLNTEAHPLPIFNWRDWEKERWNIGKTLHESLGLDKTMPVETATGAGADTGAGVKGGLKQHDWEFKGPETNEEKVKDYVYEDLEGTVYKGGAAAAS